MPFDFSVLADNLPKIAGILGATSAGGGASTAGALAGLGDYQREQNERSYEQVKDFASQLEKLAQDENWPSEARDEAWRQRANLFTSANKYLGNPKKMDKEFSKAWESIRLKSGRTVSGAAEANAQRTRVSALDNMAQNPTQLRGGLGQQIAQSPGVQPQYNANTLSGSRWDVSGIDGSDNPAPQVDNAAPRPQPLYDLSMLAPAEQQAGQLDPRAALEQAAAQLRSGLQARGGMNPEPTMQYGPITSGEEALATSRALREKAQIDSDMRQQEATLQAKLANEWVQGNGAAGQNDDVLYARGWSGGKPTVRGFRNNVTDETALVSYPDDTPGTPLRRIVIDSHPGGLDTDQFGNPVIVHQKFANNRPKMVTTKVNGQPVQIGTTDYDTIGKTYEQWKPPHWVPYFDPNSQTASQYSVPNTPGQQASMGGARGVQKILVRDNDGVLREQIVPVGAAIGQETARTFYSNGQSYIGGTEGWSTSAPPVVPSEILQKLVSFKVTEAYVKPIMALVQDSRVIGPIMGRIGGIAYDQLGGQMLTPDEQRLYGMLDQLFASRAFDEGGKALTDTEKKIFDRILPKPTDTVQQLIVKLNMAVDRAAIMESSYLSTLPARQRGQMSPASGAAPKPPAPRPPVPQTVATTPPAPRQNFNPVMGARGNPRVTEKPMISSPATSAASISSEPIISLEEALRQHAASKGKK